MILVKYQRQNDLKPYFYFALEKYILDNLLSEVQNTFFFIWQIKGVVVGKNQIIENEVNLDFVNKNKIAIFRRPTGGGCVYNDPRVPLFSIVTKRKDKNFSFKKHLQKIIDAFYDLGINLKFSGRNDILLNNLKVSGSAFMQYTNGMIMHGTLLYDCDIDTMVRVLTPNNEKLVSKGIESVRSRITNLKPYIRDNMSQEKLYQYLENYLTTTEYCLNSEQIQEIEFLSQKYSTKEWIYRQQPKHSKILKKRFLWGFLEILLVVKYGRIEEINFYGDFFQKSDNLQLFTEKFQGIVYSLPALKAVLSRNDINQYILDASNQDLLSLLELGILESQINNQIS